MLESRAGRCTLRFPFRDELTQQRGVLHGGVVTVYADAAMAIAIMPELPDDIDLITTDLHMQFIRPVTRGPIIARGEIVNRGGTLLVTAATIEVEGVGLCGRGSATFMLVPRRSGSS